MYQKRAAEDTVRNLLGVRGLTNNVVVVPRLHAAEVKEKIEAALRRNAELDAKNISVETPQGRVIPAGESAPGPSMKTHSRRHGLLQV